MSTIRILALFLFCTLSKSIFASDSKSEDAKHCIEILHFSYDDFNLSSFTSTNSKTYKHLEIGAANYGGEESIKKYGNDYTPGHKDQHLVLFTVWDQMVLKGDYDTFILYLNDKDVEGLDIAIKALEKHIEANSHNYENIKKVAIIKIAKDCFEVKEWPAVDSANLVHPFGRLTKCIFLKGLESDPGDYRCVITLFYKLAIASKNGLYVADVTARCTVRKKHMRLMQKKLNKKEGMSIENLNFKSADYPFSGYIYPNGVKNESTPICYTARPCFRYSLKAGHSPQKKTCVIL